MNDYVIKADMNAQVLAAELYEVACNLPAFTVVPVRDIKGNLDSGSFNIQPKDNLGIDGLTGHTYASHSSVFELQVSVNALHWPEDTDAAKNNALRSIFEPLVKAYNDQHKSKARLQPASKP